MKKKAAKSKVTKTPQPSFESLVDSVEWVRVTDDPKLIYGLGYVAGALSEVRVRRGGIASPPTIESNPVTLAQSLERFRFILEVEKTFDTGSTCDDDAQLRWLGELETKLAA